MNKKINGWLYPWATSLTLISPREKIGNKTRGSNEVTAKGIASVIHQIAIQQVAASTIWPSLLKELNSQKKLTIIKTIGFYNC